MNGRTVARAAVLLLALLALTACQSGEDRIAVTVLPAIPGDLSPFDDWVDFPMSTRVLQRVNTQDVEFLTVSVPGRPEDTVAFLDADIRAAGFHLDAGFPLQNDSSTGRILSRGYVKDGFLLIVLVSEHPLGSWVDFQLRP
jgi:hypothetical protein